MAQAHKMGGQEVDEEQVERPPKPGFKRIPEKGHLTLLNIYYHLSWLEGIYIPQRHNPEHRDRLNNYIFFYT